MESRMIVEGTLQSLALQAQALAGNVAVNLLQLGRVFTEAKPLVKHGEWEKWISENSGMSARWAQNCMEAYRRFGGNAYVSGLNKSQLFSLLALPEGEEQKFLTENNVPEMTTREVKEAVKAVREQMQAKIDDAQMQIEQLKIESSAILESKENAFRMYHELENEDVKLLKELDDARERLAQLENAEPVIPEYVAEELKGKDAEIARCRDEIERISGETAELINERNAYNKAVSDRDRQIKELQKMVDETQSDYDEARREILDLKSSAARGDAERDVSGRMSTEDFAKAVRSFISQVAQMPYMGKSFALMDGDEVRIYGEYLVTVEDWCKKTRKAISTVNGGVIDG